MNTSILISTFFSLSPWLLNFELLLLNWRNGKNKNYVIIFECMILVKSIYRTNQTHISSDSIDIIQIKSAKWPEYHFLNEINQIFYSYSTISFHVLGVHTFYYWQSRVFANFLHSWFLPLCFTWTCFEVRSNYIELSTIVNWFPDPTYLNSLNVCGWWYLFWYYHAIHLCILMSTFIYGVLCSND